MRVGLFIILVIAAGIGLYVWYVKKTGKSDEVAKAAKDIIDDVLPPETPEQNTEKIRVDMLQMNTRIRTTKGFTVPMLSAIERLFDKLDDIIPKLNDKWSTSDLTWETARIVTKHLPDFLAKYYPLRPEQIESKEEEFLTSISLIETEVDEVVQLFDANAVNEAGTRANIIRRKFEQAPSEA